MAVPNWAHAELIARESADPLIPLVTLTHPLWAEPQRMALDVNEVVSDGETYLPAAFDLRVVSDDDGPTKAVLAVPNVGRELAEMVQDIASYPECTIEVVALSHPDDPIYRASRLELTNINMGIVTISGDLRGKDFTSEPCGTKRVTPGRFPAFFR